MIVKIKPGTYRHPNCKIEVSTGTYLSSIIVDDKYEFFFDAEGTFDGSGTFLVPVDEI